ncbi:hypothetical protein [Inquilinus limosus]|nr:hypothetical protein [Inquilinus limosus]
MKDRSHQPQSRHGEERSDVAIQGPVRAALDGHAPAGLAMTVMGMKGGAT